MFEELIGIFLASAGIDIGAGTVLRGSSMPGPTRGENTCTPSERGVVAFEGWYEEELCLHKHFHDLCHAFVRSSKPSSLGEQVDRLIQKLQQKYRDHTGPFPLHAASLSPLSSRHVASVVMAGFEGPTSLVTVRNFVEKTARADGASWRSESGN